MEMENEALLIASSEFYYEGTPSQGSYTVKEVGHTESYINNKELYKKLETTFTITQILILILSVLSLVKAITTYSKNKKMTSEEVIEDVIKDDKKKKTKAESSLTYIMFAVVFLIGYGGIELVKKLFENR